MNSYLHNTIRTVFLIVALAISASAYAVEPKTSQHASFKVQDFERIAVIVKPLQATPRSLGSGHHKQAQTALERQIEQNFLRVLVKDGFTLVSRSDLDAAMTERGLDQANMTDEKYSEEAAKLLHVPALLVVSIDGFSIKQMQAVTPAVHGHNGASGTRTSYYQVTATIAARLVKVNDNMVMWTGDLSLVTNLLNSDQAAIFLGSMAEAVAKAFPPLKQD